MIQTFRYAMDISKITSELGWNPSHTFEADLSESIQWYLNNRDWWTKLQEKKIDEQKRRGTN